MQEVRNSSALGESEGLQKREGNNPARTEGNEEEEFVIDEMVD